MAGMEGYTALSRGREQLSEGVLRQTGELAALDARIGEARARRDAELARLEQAVLRWKVECALRSAGTTGRRLVDLSRATRPSGALAS